MPAHLKYTKEVLAPIVASSSCIRDVMRALGMRLTGGGANLISLRIKQYNLDTTHFHRKVWNRGVSGPNKSPASKVLVTRNSDYREKAFRLRRALIESGVEYRCAGCSNSGSWRGKKLTLHVEHKNGDFRDCRKENLEFLCPNCHSQTKTFSGNLGLTGLTSTAAWFRAYRRRRRGEIGSTRGIEGAMGKPVRVRVSPSTS